MTAPGKSAACMCWRRIARRAWPSCCSTARKRTRLPALRPAGAEAHAGAAGAARLVLWSDTRFDRAHRFYEKRSYVRSGPIRALADISNSLEYGFAKPMDGIEVLDAAAAVSAIPRLSEILVVCVAEGAGVS